MKTAVGKLAGQSLAIKLLSVSEMCRIGLTGEVRFTIRATHELKGKPGMFVAIISDSEGIQNDSPPSVSVLLDKSETLYQANIKVDPKTDFLILTFAIDEDTLRAYSTPIVEYQVVDTATRKRYASSKILVQSNKGTAGGKQAYGFAALGEDWPLLPGERMHDSFVAMASSGLDVQKPRYAVPKQQLQQYNKGENASGGRNHAFTKRLFR